MTHQETAPTVVPPSSVSKIKCDFVAGSLRFVARLNGAPSEAGVLAIWRNETGTAEVTDPAVTG